MNYKKMFVWFAAVSVLSGCGGGGGGSTDDNNTPMPLQIAEVSPSNLDTGVGTTEDISITFSEILNCDTVTKESFFIEENGNTVNEYEISCTNKTATITTAGLSEGADIVVTVTLDVESTEGGTLSSIYNWEFTTVTAPATVIQVAAGDDHSLALMSDGTMKAWGYNGQGQLGTGNNLSKSLPANVLISDVKFIAAGRDQSFAIKNDGTLWAFGDNTYGELGVGTKTSTSTPTPVSDLTNVVSVSTGSGHSIAVKNDGTVWTWGNNTYSQLARSDISESTVPIQVSNLFGIIQVAAGPATSLALKSDGTVWAWGENEFFEAAGNGNIVVTPTLVPIENVVGISSGGNHSVALKSDGTVWTWGWDSSGILGTGDIESGNTATPVQAINLSGVTSMDTSVGGGNFTLTLKSDGTVWTWGYNNYGQLGVSDVYTVESFSPVAVFGLTSIESISAGDYHSLALSSTGEVWAWGRGDGGQLGQGNGINMRTPVKVQNL